MPLLEQSAHATFAGRHGCQLHDSPCRSGRNQMPATPRGADRGRFDDCGRGNPGGTSGARAKLERGQSGGLGRGDQLAAANGAEQQPGGGLDHQRQHGGGGGGHRVYHRFADRRRQRWGRQRTADWGQCGADGAGWNRQSRDYFAGIGRQYLTDSYWCGRRRHRYLVGRRRPAAGRHRQQQLHHRHRRLDAAQSRQHHFRPRYCRQWRDRHRQRCGRHHQCDILQRNGSGFRWGDDECRPDRGDRQRRSDIGLQCHADHRHGAGIRRRCGDRGHQWIDHFRWHHHHRQWRHDPHRQWLFCRPVGRDAVGWQHLYRAG